MLPPTDVALAEAWARAGVPLATAEEGLRQGTARLRSEGREPRRLTELANDVADLLRARREGLLLSDIPTAAPASSPPTAPRDREPDRDADPPVVTGLDRDRADLVALLDRLAAAGTDPAHHAGLEQARTAAAAPAASLSELLDHVDRAAMDGAMAALDAEARAALEDEAERRLRSEWSDLGERGRVLRRHGLLLECLEERLGPLALSERFLDGA